MQHATLAAGGSRPWPHAIRPPRFSPEYVRRSELALEQALARVPAYREWRPLAPGVSASLDERYAALPALTKATMRAVGPAGLVPDGRDLAAALASGEVELVRTSGTTTEQVTNVWNQRWWDASEAASWKLNAATAGLGRAPLAAELTSARNVGVLSEADLPFEARRLASLLFLNEKTSHREWTGAHYERMAAELDRFAPVILEANPSYLSRLAWWAADRGRRLHEPAVILLTYELPSRSHLRSIAAAFRAPVCSSYGATEVGYAFMECEHGKLHQNVEFCRVDYEPLPAARGPADVGRILVTTFDNEWASMVRFDVGDLVRLDAAQSCPCGRDEGFVLEAVEGRLSNATYALDGRLVTTRRVDEALGAVLGLRDHELSQVVAGEYHLKVVGRGGAAGLEAACAAALREVYGPRALVRVERCDDLDTGPSGKHRRTHSEWQPDGGDLFA